MSCLRRLFQFFLTPEKRALARFISLFLAGASWFTDDYLRLKSLTLGFTAPSHWVTHIGLSKARAFFSASNLLTWKSKDLYVDPEMRVDGVCTFQTPALRTFTFGIELGF